MEQDKGQQLAEVCCTVHTSWLCTPSLIKKAICLSPRTSLFLRLALPFTACSLFPGVKPVTRDHIQSGRSSPEDLAQMLLPLRWIHAHYFPSSSSSSSFGIHSSVPCGIHRSVPRSTREAAIEGAECTSTKPEKFLPQEGAGVRGRPLKNRFATEGRLSFSAADG